MIDRIEFHDSNVEFVAQGDVIVLALRPAYVQHWERRAGSWKGTGRTQEARISISRARVVPVLPGRAREISSGWLRVGDRMFDGLIPVPLNVVGDVTGSLELVDATIVSLNGTGVNVEFTGPATDVDVLPEEWAPIEGAA